MSELIWSFSRDVVFYVATESSKAEEKSSSNEIDDLVSLWMIQMLLIEERIK